MNLCACGCGLEVRKTYHTGHCHRGKPRTWPGRPAFRDRYTIDADTGCWEWYGAKANGYGYTRVDGHMMTAHRYQYQQRHGELPERVHLHHACHNRGCVNPDHLSEISPEDHSGGAGHGKLSSEDAEEIRRLYATGDYSQSQLGRQFGVVQGHIGRIVNGQHWKAAV